MFGIVNVNIVLQFVSFYIQVYCSVIAYLVNIFVYCLQFVKMSSVVLNSLDINHCDKTVHKRTYFHLIMTFMAAKLESKEVLLIFGFDFITHATLCIAWSLPLCGVHLSVRLCVTCLYCV